MTRKDRTEGIYSRREVLDDSERRQYYQLQPKDLLSYAYRYSEDVKSASTAPSSTWTSSRPCPT
jgi:hypothetical protein